MDSMNNEFYEYLNNYSSECTLFLNRNDEFPLLSPCRISLVGNGARRTIKGGTGSGDVISPFFKSIEESLEERGFEITSKRWMDQYDEFRKNSLKDYIKDGKKKAKKAHIMAGVYTMGFFEEEKNYDIDPFYDSDACIYVLSRNSGEGNDRRCIKGDVLLSDKEVSDILYLNKKFKKFMLVLNVGGVIDLSLVKEVSNILLLSQLGAVTGSVFVKILLGELNPSGKLSTTWANPNDYPCVNSFGDLNDTYYSEGIYVGYRYFYTNNVNPLYPFGYGLSYTSFNLDIRDIDFKDNLLDITVNVKNIGKYAGKEVVEAYITKPNDRIDNPYIELCGYKKTKLLNPENEDYINIIIDITKFTTYDETIASNILLKGDYIIRIGNSSNNLTNVCKINVSSDFIIDKLNNKLLCEFKDESFKSKINVGDIKSFSFDLSKIITNVIEYKKDTYIDSFICKLSNEELARICLGHYKKGLASIIGNSCEHVVGGAGETVLGITGIDKYLTMADGPQGLRLKAKYGLDKKGIYDVSIDPMMEKMLMFLPKIAHPFIKPPKNRHGDIYTQYTTAIPIGTALAQSFNNELVENIGKYVAKEMNGYNVDLWLAPALNIHRNILCGRNFEYYSEDPYLSGMIAKSMVLGVEKSGRGATIKHFACNNQEFNRNNNNSNVSERALREIYLKGFEICIKESNPCALMTSYNLINGVHSSESYELINDILRCEWNYQGLVMTDWIQSGRSFCKRSKYKAPYSSNNILAGNDLTMPGSNKDYKNIIKAVKNKKLKREELIYSASRVYRAIYNYKSKQPVN